MASRQCVACGSKIGMFADFQICAQGCICADCNQLLKRYPGNLQHMTGAEASDVIARCKHADKLLSRISEYDYVGHLFEYVALFDDESRTVVLPKRVATSIEEQEFWPFPYGDIVSAELKENEQTVRVSGMARTIAGGVLFGGLGALAGYASAGDRRTNDGQENIRVVVNVRNYPMDVYSVELTRGKLRASDPKVETLMVYGVELVTRLNDIAGYSEEPAPEKPADTAPMLSGADEIRKYKALMDDGLITEEEFAAKKAQLLGL